MGGTSGALYSIFLNKLVSGLRELNSNTLDSTGWSKALKSALDGLYQYTRARPPSRTLVDPLDAFVNAFIQNPQNFAAAADAARDAAEATKQLKASAGRAAYVDQQELDAANVPDPGAWGVWKILEGMVSA
jgi:dihydroxyacetone kinase